ncbi:MAG: hypothetical protein EON51_02220 [Acinetobacter sp.]|nr:MAG: hypothetical protein EON51_02220 [Acinetobacter sp.]
MDYGDQTSNFYVQELNGIRKLANDLIQHNINSVPTSKDLFVVQINNMVLLFQRGIQSKQLHLDTNAIVFMDHLQTELSQVSEDCNNFLNSKKKVKLPEETRQYLEILISEVNNIFEYFKEYYDFCFNFQMKVPIRLKNKMDLVLTKNWASFISSLSEFGTENELIEIFKRYSQDLRSRKRNSFHELDFWDSIALAVNKLDFDKAANLEFNLCVVFCYHNFNYPPLMLYFTNKMQRDYDKIESYREEYFKITVDLRKFTQLIVKRGSGYDLSNNDFKETMCFILENELVFLKKLININKKLFEGNGARFILRQFYFKISISMEQFLFIFRLMIDKGIVQVKRKADLFEFIHSHIGTANKDNLSIGNMQNTYAENNRRTAIKVKSILQSLITQIDEKYLILFCGFSLF